MTILEERAMTMLRVATMAGMVAVMTMAAVTPARAQSAAMVAATARMEAQSQAMGASMLVRGARMQAESAAMLAAAVAQSVSLPEGSYQLTATNAASGDPQVKDELFAGTEKFATGASDVTDVNLGPDMLGMVSGKRGADLAHKMNFMVVRTYTYPRPGMYNMADVDAYRQKLRTGNWNCFIHTQDSKSGESTDICNRPLPNNEGSEMVIMTVEPKELTFIHMSGKGSLADLGKLGALGSLGALGDLGGAAPEPPAPPRPPAPQQ